MLDYEHILALQNRLSSYDIEACFVGELALNYYNVDRVVHDLEICVPEFQLSKATKILTAEVADKAHVYVNEPLLADQVNIFTAYKARFPRLRCADCAPEDTFHVSLIPDNFLSLAPLRKSIIPAHCRRRHDASHSAQLSDIIPGFEELAAINFPRLPPLLIGTLHSFISSGYADYSLAMLAESLIDGMDVDGVWCERHMASENPQVTAFALSLVQTKGQRLDYMHPEGVTLFCKSKEEAQRMRLVPGRDD